MSQQEENVAESIRALERLHHEMGEISAGKDTGWKFEMVKKRREQSLQLLTLAQHIDQWLPQLPDKEISQKTRMLFSDMRHAISMTQTQWPLSKIDTPEAMNEYRKATAEAIRKSEEFLAWTKRLLGMS